MPSLRSAPRPPRPRRGLGRRLTDLARRFHLPLAAAALALVGALLAATPARAAGTVTIADRSPKEDDGRWKLKMTINYGATPHLAHIPMIFSFTPTVHYERALTDQSPEKPILNRIPLQGQQSINENMDVGFSDGSGKIFNITKFDFVLRRDRGFEAGEYDLKITRTTDGVQMGQTFKITLQGDNPVIDRRAIVFAGGDKKKKKDEPKKEEKAEEKAEETPEAPSPQETPPDIPPSEAPPPVEPKQGGCGCRVAGAGGSAGAAALAAAGLAALAARRRRRAA
ncbi:MAG: MYXO-CTERM sorting domain-containing protein [Polyangiaceae bacterium]|nr:MYXO-CTERM sorting domain-containing protein [Polyangiaceae bacterium]